MQEEVCIVPAPPVCLLPVCSYTRLTAYCGILPTRSPILPERDFTPSSSARGATLAVLASSVSRILPGQEYSIVTAIAAGGTYCNVPLLIPQGQKRKMFLTAEIFLKLFFDTEKATRLFTVGWLCFYDVKSTNRNLYHSSFLRIIFSSVRYSSTNPCFRKSVIAGLSIAISS